MTTEEIKAMIKDQEEIVASHDLKIKNLSMILEQAKTDLKNSHDELTIKFLLKENIISSSRADELMSSLSFLQTFIRDTPPLIEEEIDERNKDLNKLLTMYDRYNIDSSQRIDNINCDNKLYINAHYFKIDGSVVDKPVSADKLNFDYSKYLDKKGELYFCEQYVDGVLRNVVVTSKKFSKNRAEYYESHGCKKLGIGHVLFTYVYLIPIMLLCAFCLPVYIYSAFSERLFFAVYPFFFSVLFAFIFCVLLFISLIRKNNNVSFFLHTFFLFFICADILFLLDDIAYNTSPAFSAFSVVITIIIYQIVRNYYSKRINIFANISRILDSISYIAYCSMRSVPFVALIVSYIYSVYYMFQTSFSDGLYGAFCPVLSQFTYLFTTGLLTEYAFSLYFALMISTISFLLQSNYADNI